MVKISVFRRTLPLPHFILPLLALISLALGRRLDSHSSAFAPLPSALAPPRPSSRPSLTERPAVLVRGNEKLSKRWRDVSDDLPDKEEEHSVAEGIELAKKFAKAKFTETVEIHLNLGIDPKRSDQTVRAQVTFPHSLGKTRRIAIITSPGKEELATATGADEVGGEEMIASIQEGQINFDILICSPDVMAKVGRIGKILGPKGLMPTAKMGTVTDDFDEAVQRFRRETYQYRADKTGVLHMGIGKVTSGAKELRENLAALLVSVKNNRPASASGKLFRKATLSTTMGPAIRLDPNEISAIAG
ncbi:unnamed protein product [Vitrella brassicaformis CCMP3155]|uniref:Ribosomal protein n=1 Tax=Vitrella brassicaformis (strain CCMP3155) TaxID=1169540 RepID=A0A0G4ETN5_VITBC|nr:unnamed protein product [Vitrella brassicaformis CCMP3155]|eukprot:CEM01676.1 unnamed protein product [Vitrella brassicaformis CCMP3155]